MHNDEQTRLNQLRSDTIIQRSTCQTKARVWRLKAQLLVDQRESRLRKDIQEYEVIMKAKLAEKLAAKRIEADTALMAVQQEAALMVAAAENDLKSDMEIVNRMETKTNELASEIASKQGME